MDSPKIVTKESFNVIGQVYHGKNENQEIPQLWRVLLPRFAEIKDMVSSEVSYGVMGNMDHDSGEFDYLAGYEFNRPGNVPEGMDTWTVPEQKYGVFSCTLPTLIDAFKQINQNWFPSSGYVQGDGPEFELYPKEFNPQIDDSVMHLYIPIK
jgi:AraC family transcriptional regulator